MTIFKKSQRSQRKAELSKYFREHLVVDRRGMDAKERFTWLLLHLEEYLGRWLGVLNFDNFTMRPLLESDLHTVLVLGVDAIDDEISAFQHFSPLLEKWRDFVTLVRSLSLETDKGVGTELSAKFVSVRDCSNEFLNS